MMCFPEFNKLHPRVTRQAPPPPPKEGVTILPHFFCQRPAHPHSFVPQLWVDVPGLWRNFSQVLIELFLRNAFGFGDLLLVCEPFLTQQQHGAGKLLLKSLMHRVKEQACAMPSLPPSSLICLPRISQLI